LLSYDNTTLIKRPSHISQYQNVYILDFIATKDDGSGAHNWSYKTCKAPVKLSPLANQPQLFTGWMPFLSPNQQCQSTEGKLRC